VLGGTKGLRVLCGLTAQNALVDKYEVLHVENPTPGFASRSTGRDSGLSIRDASDTTWTASAWTVAFSCWIAAGIEGLSGPPRPDPGLIDRIASPRW
jgi:hypothetical protein